MMQMLLIFIGSCLALGIVFMLFLMGSFYFNSPIGQPVDPKKPSNFFWGKFGSKKIYYATGDGNFSGGKELVGADPESFEVIENSYGKDKNHVYFENSLLDVDVETFYLDNDVPKDARYAYYLKDDQVKGWLALVIEEADPGTYHELDELPRWGKDKAHYFFENRKLDVDYGSFTYLSHAWAKDRNNLYQLSEDGFNIIAADVNALNLVSDTVIRDSEQVIFNGYMHGDDDPEGRHLNKFEFHADSPLEVMSEAHIRHHGKIYYYGVLTEIDAASFKPFINNDKTLILGYSKDKDNVYLYNKKLAHIDARSFRYDNDNFVDNDNHYDRNGDVITPLNE